MTSLTLRQSIWLVILYGVIAISLLAPIASNDYLAPAEFNNHLAGIVQAKMAMAEGQFPIRVAPWQNQGWGNAYFQFYSPLPYTIGGLIYGIHGIKLPLFFYYKLLIWGALILAGFFCYRLAYWLTGSKSIGVLSGVVYMTAPYFLININTRGDMTESIAQGLVPMVVYYALRCFMNPMDWHKLFWTGIGWAALALTHLLTFIYTSLFLGLFLVVLTLLDLRKCRQLLHCGLGYGLALGLLLWYLLPIAKVEQYLFIHEALYNPFDYAWLTVLPAILSLSVVSPMPLPGNGGLIIPLCFAIGWPILLAVSVSFYSVLQGRSQYDPTAYQINIALLIVFCLAFFMIWSPINFWPLLPKWLASAQFSYRLLTQILWIGMLLFAYALSILFNNQMKASAVVIGVLLIGLTARTWLPTNQSTTQEIEKLKSNPDLSTGQYSYLVSPESLSDQFILTSADLPFMSVDNWLLLNREMTLPTHLLIQEPNAMLTISGSLPTYLFHQPITLRLEANHHIFNHRIAPGKFNWHIPVRDLLKTDQGPLLHLRFTSKQPFIPSQHDPHSGDNRLLTVEINKLALTGLSPDSTILPVSDTAKNCARLHGKIQCDLSVGTRTGLIQLPILYYPGLLDIKVNGQATPYLPLADKDFVLTGIRLKPGQYHVTSRFIGIRWANWVSSITVFILLLGLMWERIVNNRLKGKNQSWKH